MPYWFTNATVYNNAVIFPFSPDNLHDYNLAGYFHRGEETRLTGTRNRPADANSFIMRVPLSAGVTSSGNFPIAMRPLRFRSTMDPNNPYFYLMDGGVADNIGVITALRLLTDKINDDMPRKVLVVIDSYQGGLTPFEKEKKAPAEADTAARLMEAGLDSWRARYREFADKLCERKNIKPVYISFDDLVEKQIIKIAQRTVLKSLPAVPEGMLIKHEKVILNDDQQKALTHITSRINENKFGVTLLFGVTDSGKTELYIKAIEQTIRNGKTAIVMLPEIALTTQTIQRFSARFEKIAVMHSGLTAPQRNTQWHKIKSGEADVVIGARSAVFAPLNNLGLIVVDEEHEPSYKQDTTPRYHGRDVAIKRAQLCNAHCILGSATPSLETLQNCKTKRAFFNMVRLPRRVMNLPFPEMRLVDMKNYASQLMSEPLETHLAQTLARNEQAILLLNRRGYSNFVFCPSCKHILRCRNCDVTLTFHKTPDKQIAPIPTITGRHMHSGHAICHYCGSQSLVPQKCPLCGKGMTMIGLGSQRLEEDLANKFPNAKVARVDSDSMKGADYYRILRDFSEGKINILAGTQILAKGLHFPNVTLVGIISADTSLYLPDFRSNERTFQLISQVAGRAGRSAKKGVVFIQTFLTNQPAIQFALKGDFVGFVQEELKHRAICNLPPFWRLALITLRDRTFEKLEIASRLLREKIDRIIAEQKLQIKVRGPIPAIITRIQTFHRMQIILQAPQPAVLHELFSTLRTSPPIRPAVTITIDIDPVDLL